MKTAVQWIRGAVLLAAIVPNCSLASDSVRGFLANHCVHCHDSETKKGGLDLATLGQELADGKNFSMWVNIHDRVKTGEMPPKGEMRPERPELQAFTESLSSSLLAADQQRVASEGRATQRRLNRYEYENVLRDLLAAPWLQIKDSLPEDGEAHRFNKSGDSLDISHVQMSRYLAVAEYAMRQVIAHSTERPETRTVRYYTREERSFARRIRSTKQRPERSTFPVLGKQGQPDVRTGRAPMTVGAADPEQREQEGIGLVASTYEPIEVKFDGFKAPIAGRYRLRFSTHTVWVGPGKGQKWFIPNFDDISAGRPARGADHDLFGDTSAAAPAAGQFRCLT